MNLDKKENLDLSYRENGLRKQKRILKEEHTLEHDRLAEESFKRAYGISDEVFERMKKNT